MLPVAGDADYEGAMPISLTGLEGVAEVPFGDVSVLRRHTSRAPNICIDAADIRPEASVDLALFSFSFLLSFFVFRL